jgi:hypothetical protein
MAAAPPSVSPAAPDAGGPGTSGGSSGTPAQQRREARARRPVGAGSLLVLGASLARRGIMSVAALVICVVTAVVCALVTMLLAARGPQSPAHDVPLVASSALAWGGGFLLAFAAAAHALRRDRAQGVRALFVSRTTSLRGYLFARVGGLALLIALAVAGGTLFCGLVGVASAARFAGVSRMLHATFAGVVFSLAFSAVVAPVAFAALGARSRIGGYLFLIAVVMLPEVIVGLMGSFLPESVADVLSIPSALSALRTALAPGTVDVARAARALVALSLVIAFAMFLVRRDAILVEEPEADA